ncbi:MAG: hypothetical protein U0165_03595 [Polyangiaceae bacterium]
MNSTRPLTAGQVASFSPGKSASIAANSNEPRALELAPGDAITIRIAPGATVTTRALDWIGFEQAGWSSERAFGDACRAWREAKSVRVVKVNKRWRAHAGDLAKWLESEAERQREAQDEGDEFARRCRAAGVAVAISPSRRSSR